MSMSHPIEVTGARVPKDKVKIVTDTTILREAIIEPSNWDVRFLNLAKHISQWSKDPSTKCGAVIVDDYNCIKSVGYNGFARGIEDTPERLNDRPTKYKLIIHAEENAILHATCDLRGCTLYTWPFMTCDRCASRIIEKGIKRVVAPYSENERWVAGFVEAAELYNEVGVNLDLLMKNYKE